MSDKIKHTPGPWAWRKGFNGLDGPGHDNQVLCHEPYEGMWLRYKNREANARLIAAAPELLEALREVRDWLLTPGDGCLSDAALGRIVEAIAKATGGHDAK